MIPFAFYPSEQPCARCGMPVSYEQLCPVSVVEFPSGKLIDRCAHLDSGVCRENLR